MNRPTPIEIRRELHQIPEPGFAEYKTQAYLLRYIQTLPQDLLQIKTWKTGILMISMSMFLEVVLPVCMIFLVGYLIQSWRKVDIKPISTLAMRTLLKRLN